MSLTHDRRKFFKATENSCSSQGIVDLLDEIFNLNRKTTKLSENDRYHFLRNKMKPKLEEVYNRIILAGEKISSKTALSDSVSYMINQKAYLMNVFNAGYFELSNNSVERAVKENVMGRTNWFFSYSFDGS
ncbi:IS66 family transposase [Ligilactobacillus equi]|uniref:IS66 family transposase n=1 Tax=Ligilactobacillus equi TaxID=137357 RepID=UPI0009DF4FB3|nr:transposase [Ligilactobacillus equi]